MAKQTFAKPSVIHSLRYVGFFCILFFQCIVLNANAVSKDIALNIIKNANEFEQLSAEPDSSTTARTETLKFMLDRKNKRKLWFFNTKKYTYHYAFAAANLNSSTRPIASHEVFNLREYSSKNRRFEMGSVIHYKDQDLWVMQLMAGDSLTAEEIARLFHDVKQALWSGSQLHFLPMSQEQDATVNSLTHKLPLVTADQVFKGVHYQPLTQGRAFGYLRIVKGDVDLASVRPNQILVLEKLPEEIPVAAAVISQQLQAPLAHIALLCGSRGTPNMGLRDALNNKEIQLLDGQLVELNINPQEYSLRSADIESANEFWKKLRPVKPKIPEVDVKEKRLLNISDLKLSNTNFAGAKAAQLGEVASLKPAVVTPGGFVIPLSYYFEHINKPKIKNVVNGLFDQKNNDTSSAKRYAQLDLLRAEIETTSVDAQLVATIKSRMASSGHVGRWILRSSTNAEDLTGFNGAGLYRSIKIKANASDAELIDALRKVWASVWLQTAFEERAWYGVDHRAVGMAVLVQPFVEDAVANGVAISANPFAEFRPGVLINAQPSGGSVTGAGGDEIPEQHLVYTFTEELDFEFLSKSSRMPDGKTILNKAILTDLTNQLVQLHKHFMRRWDDRANAVDVEFLVMADGHIVILQARPYNLIYSKDQRIF